MAPLKQLRKDRGLTQQTVAHAVQIDRSAIAHWERGKNLPSIVVLPELARLYHVSLDTLIEVIKANIALHRQNPV